MRKKYYIIPLILSASIFIASSAWAILGDNQGGGSSGSSGSSRTEISTVSSVATIYQNKNDKSYVIEVRDRTNLKEVADKLREVLFVKNGENYIPLLDATELTLKTELFFKQDGNYLFVTSILVPNFQGVMTSKDHYTLTVNYTGFIALHCVPGANFNTSGNDFAPYPVPDGWTWNRVVNAMPPIVFCKKSVEATPPEQEKQQINPPITNKVLTDNDIVEQITSKPIVNVVAKFSRRLADILNPQKKLPRRTAPLASLNEFGGNMVYAKNLVVGRISKDEMSSVSKKIGDNLRYYTDGLNYFVSFRNKKGNYVGLQLTAEQVTEVLNNPISYSKNPNFAPFYDALSLSKNFLISDIDLLKRAEVMNSALGNEVFRYDLISATGRYESLGKRVAPSIEVNTLYSLITNKSGKLGIISKNCSSKTRVDLNNLAEQISC